MYDRRRRVVTLFDAVHDIFSRVQPPSYAFRVLTVRATLSTLLRRRRRLSLSFRHFHPRPVGCISLNRWCLCAYTHVREANCFFVSTLIIMTARTMHRGNFAFSIRHRVCLYLWLDTLGRQQERPTWSARVCRPWWSVTYHVTFIQFSRRFNCESDIKVRIKGRQNSRYVLSFFFF